MLEDARRRDDPSEINADLCIVGAGAAGLTLAKAFSGRKESVVLIESGDLEFDPDTQALYEGNGVGFPYHPLDATRLRYFGGTTNHWTGWCRPLDDIDFTVRDWVPYSGWPFSKAEIARYYPEAAEILDLRSADFDPADLIRHLPDEERKAANVDPARFQIGVFRFSRPTRFGTKYRDLVEKSENIRCLLNANVIDILTNERADTVSAVQVATLNGRKFQVRAREFVLCLGGLENPRLLLSANKVQKGGLGNGNDLVGRFFMDHIEMALGIVALPGPASALRPFFSPRGGWQLSYALSEQSQREGKLLNVNATLNEISSSGEASVGFGAMRRIGRAVARGEFPDHLIEDIGHILADFDEVAKYLWARALGRREETLLVIMNRSEVAPNPDSRVTLDDTVDALGMRRIKLDWRLSDLDRRSIHQHQKLLGEELARLGIGRVRVGIAEDAPWPPNVDGGHHHMGTTRMSDDPKQGVVDQNCKVHGIANLYVAGSSVFPTVGNANPTLTIVAMALRLAEHLRSLPTRS